MKLSVTNCYLLKAGKGYVLVDTAYDWEWDAFCKGLGKAGVGFGDLEYLILTHHHDDHAGLLNQLVAQNPRIKIVISQRAPASLAKGRNEWARGAGYLNRRVNVLMTLNRMVNKKWTQVRNGSCPRMGRRSRRMSCDNRSTATRRATWSFSTRARAPKEW